MWDHVWLNCNGFIFIVVYLCSCSSVLNHLTCKQLKFDAISCKLRGLIYRIQKPVINNCGVGLVQITWEITVKVLHSTTWRRLNTSKLWTSSQSLLQVVWPKTSAACCIVILTCVPYIWHKNAFSLRTTSRMNLYCRLSMHLWLNQILLGWLTDWIINPHRQQPIYEIQKYMMFWNAIINQIIYQWTMFHVSKLMRRGNWDKLYIVLFNVSVLKLSQLILSWSPFWRLSSSGYGCS